MVDVTSTENADHAATEKVDVEVAVASEEDEAAVAASAEEEDEAEECKHKGYKIKEARKNRAS